MSLKKKTQLRIASLALVTALLSGCTYRSQTEGDNETASTVSYEVESGSVRNTSDAIGEEIFYNTEKLALPLPEYTLDEGYSLSYTQFYSPVFVGDYLFTYVEIGGKKTTETPGGPTVETAGEAFWAFYDLNGKYVGRLSGFIPQECFFHAEEDGFVAVYSKYDYERDNGDQLVYKVDLDLTGNITFGPRVIYNHPEAFINHVLFAENGHILFSYGNTLINLDSSEKVLCSFDVTSNRTCAGIWEDAGKSYIQLRVHSDEKLDSYELYQLIYDTNGMVSMSPTCRTSDNLAGMHISQDNGKLYAATKNSMGTIDLTSGEFGCLMDWNQTDCDRNVLTSGSVKILSEGVRSSTLNVISANKTPSAVVEPQNSDTESSSIQASSKTENVTSNEASPANEEMTRLCIAEIETDEMGNQTAYLIRLTPAEKNPHSSQKQIWIGGVGISSSPITKYISQYNSDTTQAAWIKLYDYADYRLEDMYDSSFYRNAAEQDMAYEINFGDNSYYLERTKNMEKQISAGVGPDIIVSSGDFLAFCNSNYLTDLNPYIKSIHGIDRNKYFSSVLEAFEVDGNLYQIPLYFQNYALLGNICYTDGKEDMNYHDLSFAQALYSDNMQLFAHMETSTLMRIFVEGELASWIDYEHSSVSIDRSSLVDMLELLKVTSAYGNYTPYQEYIWTMDPSPFCFFYEFRDWNAIFCSASTNTLEEYLQYKPFNGHAKWFGYPGSSGCSMLVRSDLTLGITSYTTQKELAWEIITYLLSDEAQLGIAQTSAYRIDSSYERIPLNINAFRTLNSKYQTTTMYSYAVFDENDTTFDYSDYLVDEYQNLLSSPKRRYASDPRIYKIVSYYFDLYMMGSLTVTEAAERIESEIKAALSS